MRTTIALTILLAACSSAPSAQPQPQPQPPTQVLPSPTPVAAAETQEQALAATTSVDLPLLRTADRVKITYPRAEPATTVERTGADVSAIVGALVVKQQSPSGGVMYAQLAFYRGETLLREIWMYDYGEWGITRPGTSWTLGTSASLASLIKAK